ncbi:hypothetical protein LAD73_01600 [Mycoplasma sp. 1331]|uniref:Uncharacterized protein n=1 Tax=Mycoplasma tauri TaxID=547987 RepID=A0A953NG36_9MOLU|nr:hypothetical protein [Mycoplasma tauri]MBZ4195414.1 hypothetical protein [Mycoplasma tauri]
MNKKSILGLLPIVATTTLPIISVSCTNKQERALDETKKEAEVKELENAKKEYTKSLTAANELKNSLGENPLYSDIKSKLVTAITSAESKTKTNPTKDLYNQAKGELDLAIKTAKDEKMKIDAAEQKKGSQSDQISKQDDALDEAKKEYTKSLTAANELKNSLGENPLYSDIKSKLVTAITSAESKTKTNPTKDLYNQAKGELDLAIKTAKDEKMKIDAAEQKKGSQSDQISKQDDALDEAKKEYTKSLTAANELKNSLGENPLYSDIKSKLVTVITSAESKTKTNATKDLYNQAKGELDLAIKTAKDEKMKIDAAEQKKQKEESQADQISKQDDALDEAKKEYTKSLTAANELKNSLGENPLYSDIKSKLVTVITSAESKTKTNATKDLYNQAKGELDLAIKTAKDEKMKIDAAEQKKQKEAKELNAAKTKYEETLMNAESFNESLKSDGNEYNTISQKLTIAIETAKSTITDKPTKELYIKAESKLNQDLEAAKAEKTAKDEEIKSQKEAEAREFEKAKKDFEESLLKANELKARLEKNVSLSEAKSKLEAAITNAESKTKTNPTKDLYVSEKTILDKAIKEANAKEREAFSKSLNKLTPVKFQREGNYLTLTLSTSKDNYEKIKWERLKMLIDNGNGRVYEEYAAPFDNWDQSDKSKKLIYHIRKVDKGGIVTFDISSDHQYNNNEKGNYKVTSVLISGDTKNNLLERESEIVKIQ